MADMGGDVMITVEHTGKWTNVSWSVRDSLVNETREFQVSYFSGREPPNYPMPAIPLQVEYIFNEPPQLIDGIFIRNHEQWMQECWYRDGCLI